ncbi:hypothetical protein EYY60_06865 [Flavobacterium zhairuonense]|uniref:DUF6932 family protein n=1 Tax=Flavobacterium zhairuonense TaxID=2493631 RepID=UPI001043314A|nr:hypothetical protein [Flavobacterium zhairuonense]KAF2512823.1 hypothetical protein EYY60_06865 [Flavobacterium zhairuonense]
MIPKFDHNFVIPPHLGNPTSKEHLSPYCCTTLELCQTFVTSQNRIEILKGLLSFRKKMNDFGITQGFQWLDGSFTEDVENRENRPPNDLDLVTFFGGISIEHQEIILKEFIEFGDSQTAKLNYKLDHYPVDYCYSPDVTVELTRYWIQLFTHNRLGIWKGILRLELNTPHIDEESYEYLKKIVL